MTGQCNDSSSSEDDDCLENFKESIDQDFFSQSIISEKGSKFNQNAADTKTSTNGAKDPEVLEDSHFENHGLSQSNRDFIAKKLIIRLNETIRLEDTSTSSSESVGMPDMDSGIKLLASSSISLTKSEEPCELPINRKRKEIKPFDEKLNKQKCKEVAVGPENIISQNELKHWTDRKPSKVFRYKKHKKTLIEVE